MSSLLAAPLLSEPLRRLASPVYGRTVADMDAESQALFLDVTVAWNESGNGMELPVLFSGTPMDQSGGTSTVTRGYLRDDTENVHRTALPTSNVTAGALDGSGHGVQVHLSDTLGEFAAKLQQACEQLHTSLMRMGNSRALELARRYKEVQIGPNHVVLAFSPSHPTSTQDQFTALLGAHEDPDSWRPLDKDLTFRDYVSRFAFGQDTVMPPCLRVVSMSERLRRANTHCRRLLAEERLVAEGIFETRFAWAVYKHREDGDSCEWRPCLLHGMSTENACVASWLHHSSPPVKPPPTSGLLLDSTNNVTS